MNTHLPSYERLDRTPDEMPIYGWTRGVAVEEEAVRQLANVAQLPFIHDHIAVMPDANMQASVANIMGSAFGCSGQRCLAGSVVIAVGDAYEPLKAQFSESEIVWLTMMIVTINGWNRLAVGFGKMPE